MSINNELTNLHREVEKKKLKLQQANKIIQHFCDELEKKNVIMHVIMQME